jgi:hypothetical protein
MAEQLENNNYFKQLLVSLEANIDELSSLEYDYLLPQEVESLKALPYFPKITAENINRHQALALLGRFKVGITLESRVYELGIDKNKENGKVTAQ